MWPDVARVGHEIERIKPVIEGDGRKQASSIRTFLAVDGRIRDRSWWGCKRKHTAGAISACGVGTDPALHLGPHPSFYLPNLPSLALSKQHHVLLSLHAP